MTKKSESSGATLVEKLTRPVSWRAFVDVMTHEIRVGPGGKKQGRDFADLDGEAEKLLLEAQQQAAHTGVPVEQILAGMGMLPKGGSEQSVDRRVLLNQLGWESLSGEWKAPASIEIRTPSQEGAKPAAKPTNIQLLDEMTCLRRMQTSISQLTIDELSELLDSMSHDMSSLKEQLLVGRVIPPDHLEDAWQASEEEGSPALWLLLLSCGADPERFAAWIKSLTWFPILHEEKGEWVDFLADEGMLTFRQYKSYLEQRKQGGISSTQRLAEFVAPAVQLQALSTFFELDILEQEQFGLVKSLDADGLMPVLRAFDVVPLSLEEPVAFGGTRPLSAFVRALLEEQMGECDYYLLHEDEYEKRRAAIQGALIASRHADAKQKAKDIGLIREMITNTSAVRLVENMFEKALEMKATDIHLEHQNDMFRVRFRVDSILQEAFSIHPELAEEVISRIKILAGMDITERRKPQDGHIKVSIDGIDVNMRVATAPTHRGERISIRLLNSGQVAHSLIELGFSEEELERFLALTRRPYGMILTTGPVGSGKTTTLYSGLAHLNYPEKNIITIEDPVEYELDGINQIEVNYRIDFGFAQGLRSILRQDPNVILVGEIRDHETAAIAVRASMTGLLVFSSLHTNDAPGAVTTFYNFQIAPLLIANSLLGVVAQRLVRRLCPSCREVYEPSQEEIELFIKHKVCTADDPIQELARPVGCEECMFTGYSGRTGIFEMMEVTAEIRELIMEQASERAIRDAAIANGMVELAQAGLEKCRELSTSLDEVRRVVFV